MLANSDRASIHDNFDLLGDNDRDWVCDCKPTYLYYPPKSACYRVYSKGPCKDKLILTPGPRAVPVCRKSVCPEPQVQFNGTCATLKDANVCKPRGGTLKINAKTLVVECSLLSSRVDIEEDESQLDFDEIAFGNDHCYGGGKRAQNAIC